MACSKSSVFVGIVCVHVHEKRATFWTNRAIVIFRWQICAANALYRIGASIRTFQNLHIVIRAILTLVMKQKKKNTLCIDSVVLKLREKVSKKCVTTWNTWLITPCERFLFLCAEVICRRNTEKMDPYRNTVHLEDKREEFENCYKLER